METPMAGMLVFTGKTPSSLTALKAMEVSASSWRGED